MVVITFDVHPRAVTVGKAPPLVTSLAHRLLLLEREGVDATIVLHFDETLREMSAERFVDEILVKRIGVRVLVLGHDSHFGKDRRGDFDLAKKLLAPHGVHVERVEPVRLDDGRIVSSPPSATPCLKGDSRRARNSSDVRRRSTERSSAATDADGRSVSRRRTSTSPASCARRAACTARRSRSTAARCPAVVNIGGRPTFHPEGDAADTVEVHVLDWTGDLYGRALEVRLFGRIRDERRFAGAEELAAQIARDVAEMRERVARGEWRLA